MTSDQIEQAVAAGVHPTLSEWMELSDDVRAHWSDSASDLLRSCLMVIASALRGEEEATQAYRALLHEDARIESAVYRSAHSLAAESKWQGG